MNKDPLKVGFMGVLAKFLPERFLEISLVDPITVSDLITRLDSYYGIKVNYIFSRDPAKANEVPSLIVVNGKEINTKNGTETKVKGGDQVVFVPVAHGG
ncbi:MAG TPA: MoaD/ThiS family protein [Candidatus Bathyarchaeia archaeon]|nr:MoaD/ThiS family protein [Candidatus Bathyarchaeia archaeon]